MPTSRSDIERLAHQIWQDNGRPDGLAQDHWAEAERRLSKEAVITSTELHEQPGLERDNGATDLQQDTPGRPKSASSRQQTQSDQVTQSGSTELDGQQPSAPRTSARSKGTSRRH